MRLDYCALWIDDQPRHVKGFKERIETHLSERGFALQVIQAEGIDAASARIAEQRNTDGIDLILVDYDLGPGYGGEEVLRIARERFPYKDIMFYSAAETKKLRDLAHTAKIDGVHFSTRMSLADDAISLIDKTLQKVMDIDHMRGVVMAATSDIDLMVEKSLLTVYHGFPQDRQVEYVKEVCGKLKEKLAEWSEDLDSGSAGGLDGILALKHLCTAADRLNLLLKQIEAKTEGKSNELEKAKDYRKQVVPRRNKLAHLALKTLNGARVLASSDGEIDAEEMRSLRCDLLDHRANFEYIGVLLDVRDV